MDQLDTMRAFVAVALEGSFTGAGKRLGMSTKLVSKYVQHLETRLKTQFFNRTTRSVSLTDAGAAYLERCRPILDQMDELDSLVLEKQQVLAGPVRITAPTGFGANRLSKALVPFMHDNPEVFVDLRLTDNRVALVEEGLDLAIRIGPLRDSTLMAKKLSDMRLVLVASPDYLARNGIPKHPSALATHECLLDNNQGDYALWRFKADDQEETVRVRGNLRANSPGAIANMAVGGLGIARAPIYTVEDDLKSGKLIPLLQESHQETYGLYALYPPNRHLTARVRALIDHLAAYFAGSGW